MVRVGGLWSCMNGVSKVSVVILGTLSSSASSSPHPLYQVFVHGLAFTYMFPILALPALLSEEEGTDVDGIYMALGLGTCPLCKCRACCLSHYGSNEGSSIVVQSLLLVDIPGDWLLP